jgi:propionyl-CoA carboxylase alpha chain
VTIPSGWRNNRWRPQRATFTVAGDPIDVDYVAGDPAIVTVGGTTSTVRWDFEIDGVRRHYRVVQDGEVVVVHSVLGTTELREVPRFPPARRDDVAGGCVAPMTGVVRAVNVAAGDRVAKGAVLLVLEAMKMEHEMVAQADGVVKEVRVEVGQMVDPDAVLVIVGADS